MDLRQLRTFQAVAELGSVSKASDRLHVAPAALSRQIKLLEHELRTPLFDRNGRGMQLTDAGRLLASRVAGVLKQIEQVRHDIESLEGAPSGHVSLGIVPTVSAVLAGRLAVRVAQALPNVSLRIVESYGGHLVDWLHKGEIDAAIIYGEPAGLHLAQEELAIDELTIIGPAGSGVADESGGSLAWLARQRLVLPSRMHGLRQLLERVAQRRRLQLDVRIEADSFRALIDIVERGIACSVLPPSAIVAERKRGTLETATLTQPRVPRRVVLAHAVDRPSSLAVEAVTALIREQAVALGTAKVWTAAARARR
jgi:DNA-binding transcriptional LysR family regulator